MVNYDKISHIVNEAVYKALSTDIDDSDINFNKSDIDGKFEPYAKEFAEYVDADKWDEAMKLYDEYGCRYVPYEHDKLQHIINRYMYNVGKMRNKIDFNWINTINITDMSNIFTNINKPFDISRWDTSNVTNMNGMFYGCTEFNSDLSHFNVSNVTDMTHMFSGCTSFNQDISMWNVQNVTHTIGMFEGCEWFDQNLNDWGLKFKNLKNTFKMFKGCVSYNGKMDKWKNCMSTVTNMASMFESCISFKQNLNKWDIRSAKNVNKMFRGTKVDPNKITWDLSRFENVNLF